MTLKCTAFFVLGNGGWSETWFRDGSDIAAGKNALTHYINDRLGICAPTVSSNGLRVSVVENPAIVTHLQGGDPGTFASGRDITNAALMAEAVSATYERRQLWLRGVPDAMIVGGQYAPTTPYGTAIQVFFQTIKDEAFAIRSIKRANPLQPIATISTTGLVTLVADPGWDRGMMLKFFRARFDNGTAIRKSYLIGAKVDPLNYQLLGWPAGRTALNVRARWLDYLLFRPTNIFVSRAGTRRTGRPFGQPVGRRRVARV